MIKTTKLKTIYLVEDQRNDLQITAEISNDKLVLLNHRGKNDFVFDCDNSKERRAKWRAIAKLITRACDLV